MNTASREIGPGASADALTSDSRRGRILELVRQSGLQSIIDLASAFGVTTQ